MIMKKMKALEKTVMTMMMRMMMDSIPEDLFLSTIRKRRSQEDFNLWVKTSIFIVCVCLVIFYQHIILWALIFLDF